MIKAYLFDMDGTFLDTEKLWAKAMVELVRDYGVESNETAMLGIVLGRSWRNVYAELLQLCPALSKWTMNEMALVVREYFHRLSHTESIVIEESAALLCRLAKEKPVAVVSGSPHDDVVNGVKLIGAHSDVKLLLGAEDYPRGKPFPDGYLRAAELLGVEPSACVVFEDSSVGVQSAKAAGMHCVALSRVDGERQDVSGADWVLTSLGQYSDHELMERIHG